MWDRRKLLLAAILFTALFCKATAKLLDMAPDAVDDIYGGCRQQAMEKFIKSGLLKQELSRSKGFQKAWSAGTQCSKVISGGMKEHTAALMAYTTGDENFIKTFDSDVKRLGVNVSTYEEDFHLKSFHFLLMDSLNLLSPNTCKTLYILSDKNKAQEGSKVRFGSFNTASSNYEASKGMVDLDGQVIFNITSCFFATLGDHVCTEDKDMVLLSPAEVFTVEKVNELKDADDSEYTEIVLMHSKLDSVHNCYIFSRAPADVSTQWLVFVILSLFFLNC